MAFFLTNCHHEALRLPRLFTFLAGLRSRLGSRTIGNIAWALMGSGLPLIVGVIAVPRLIEGLGIPRFGLLSLAWVVVGYFSLFDLSLGRAMTQFISESLGKKKPEDIPTIVFSGLWLMILLGLVGGALFWLLSPLLVSRLAVPDTLRAETLSAFLVLAIGIPFVVVSTGVRGILEGYQRLDIVNMVRIPLGVMTFLGPLLVLPFSNRLPEIVAVLVLARALSCFVYIGASLRLYPELRSIAPSNSATMRKMLTFGGWMTLSNVVGPLLLYLGRIFLAILVSAEAVAYFSTPYDVVINLLIIPISLVSVYFPIFAQAHGEGHALLVRQKYRQAQVLNAVAIVPLALMTAWLAKPLLALWINPAFAEQSYVVAQWIAIGVLINSFGHVSQALVQAHGRPDLTAKLHLAELVTYVPYLWWLTTHYGVVGAAVAWVIRVLISTICLAIMAQWCIATRRSAGPSHGEGV